jgi:hypothetical protein
MKGWRKRLEDLMNAVSFAEANEHDIALSFVDAKENRYERLEEKTRGFDERGDFCRGK